MLLSFIEPYPHKHCKDCFCNAHSTPSLMCCRLIKFLCIPKHGDLLNHFKRLYLTQQQCYAKRNIRVSKWLVCIFFVRVCVAPGVSVGCGAGPWCHRQSWYLPPQRRLIYSALSQPRYRKTITIRSSDPLQFTQ